MKTASAGTMESNDCMMVVSTSESRQIDIESIVFKQFGDQIKAVITQLLDELNQHHIHVRCYDKGALDYTVRARLITAIHRLEAKDET